jgi:hypothetical protein
MCLRNPDGSSSLPLLTLSGQPVQACGVVMIV